MAKTHITAQGDTFDALALLYYNNEKLSSSLIQANLNHCSTLIFEAGVSLVIPEVHAVTLPETLPPWRREA